MTTRVIIKSPAPNAEDVLVQTTDASGSVRLTDGEEQEFYVYTGQMLIISEIPKIRKQ